MHNLTTKQKILRALRENKEELSVAQIRSRYNVRGVTQRVHELRKAGEPIYTNVVRGSNGKRFTYRYGTYTQKMVHILSSSKNLNRDWGRVISSFYAKALGRVG